MVLKTLPKIIKDKKFKGKMWHITCRTIDKFELFMFNTDHAEHLLKCKFSLQPKPSCIINKEINH